MSGPCKGPSLFYNLALTNSLKTRYMKSIAKCLGILLGASLAMPLNAQEYLWSGQIEGVSASSYSKAVNGEITASGEVVLTGNYLGTVDMDPSSSNVVNITSSSAAHHDVFMGKYDAGGALIWHKEIKGNLLVEVAGSTIDQQDNLFVTGNFSDSIDFNPGVGAIFVSGSGQDGYIAKYNGSGTYQWTRLLKATKSITVLHMAGDANGQLYVVGTFEDTVDMDPGPGVTNLYSAGGGDAFFAKYNSSGNLIWARQLTGPQDAEAHAIVIDASDNVFLGGKFEGTIDFDPGNGTSNLTSSGINDLFFAKYSSSGTYLWAYQLGGPLGEAQIDLDLTSNGLVATGGFQGVMNASPKSGNNSLTSAGGNDIFVARYDLNANHVWSYRLGGAGQDAAVRLELDSSDDYYIIGTFSGTVDFDPGTGDGSLTAGTGTTTFYARYDFRGDFEWVDMIKGSGQVEPSAIKVDAQEKVYAFGAFSGTADFGTDTLARNHTAGGIRDAYLAKYSQCASLTAAITTTNASCGDRDGTATAVASGGIAPYAYTWTSGDTLSTADSLAASIYFVTITDAVNCTYTSDPVTVSDNTGPQVSVQAQLDATCHGKKDGAIVLNVAGGTPPYQFQWSNGSTAQSINGLKAGGYEVKVTDDNSCEANLRVVVKEPEPLLILPVVTRPTCGNNDGSVTAVVTGGTGGYLYNWNPGSTGASQFNIPAGVYRITVTDQNSCEETLAIPVSDVGAANIRLDSVVHAACTGGGGSIYIQVSGGVPAYTYSWSPTSSTGQDLLNAQPGEYDLIVTDQAGCKAAFTEVISARKPAKQEICIVDVDSLTGYAQVVWEKPQAQGTISKYRIFRETSSQGVFDLIDSLEFSDLSLYQDKFADTWNRPWTYTIAAVDSCGVESDRSDEHTTIHAVINRGLASDFNILWTTYQGNFAYSSYKCWRYTTVNGWELVTTVPTSIRTFTDQNAPSTGNDLFYVIEIDHPNGCTATEAKGRNSSRSNRGSIIKPEFTNGIQEQLRLKESFTAKLFPNPNSGAFKLEITSSKPQSLQIGVLDVQGRIISHRLVDVTSGAQVIQMNLEGLRTGYYTVEINSDTEGYYHPMIVE